MITLIENEVFFKGRVLFGRIFYLELDRCDEA